MKNEIKRNIFLNIIRDENSATELFRNLLSYKPFRGLILGEFLENTLLSTINDDEINTQTLLPNNMGRPDLTIKNDDVEILFEMKIDNASLTDNQPNNYQKYLSTRPVAAKWLVFLIPSDYQLLDKLKNQLMASQEMTVSVKNKIIFWEDVIRLIRQSDLLRSNDLFREYLNLLEDWFEIKKISISTEEARIMTDVNMPKSLIKLFSIIDGLKDYYSKKFKVKIGSNNEEYGLSFLTKTGETFFYIGIWYKFWAKHAKQICYGIENAKSSEKEISVFTELNVGHFIDEDQGKTRWRMSWVDEKIYSESDFMPQLVKILDRNLDCLAKGRYQYITEPCSYENIDSPLMLQPSNIYKITMRTKPDFWNDNWYKVLTVAAVAVEIYATLNK